MQFSSVFPSDEDILEEFVNSSNVSSQAPQPDLLNSTPQGPGSTYHSSPQLQKSNQLQGPDIMPQTALDHPAQGYMTPAQGLSAPSHPAQTLIGSLHSSPTSPMGSQENMSRSTGSLNMLESYVG
jgi:hypothetical protein